MAKTIKITSNNEISVVDVDFDDYRAIQKVVGGMFETVKTQRMFDYFGKPVMMLVDEEGILKQLPLNRTGSRFYGYPIVGDFILAVPTYEDIVAPDETDFIYIGGPLWDILWRSGKESFLLCLGSGRKWRRVSAWKSGKENSAEAIRKSVILRHDIRKKNRKKLITGISY